MLLSIEGLEKKIATNPELKLGCIVDTNVVFATSFPLDTYNEWGEQVFHTLHKLDIPIFTNLNVRSEFIDLNRRVMIPEGLVDFYENFTGTLDERIEASLKSLRTRKRKANEEGKTFKLNDSDIKQYMDLLDGFKHPSGEDGWPIFCREYFAPYIQNTWEEAITIMKISFLGTREIESKQYFDRHPSWENVMKIVGLSGIGSSDAMIVNLFQESKIPMIVTADKAVANTVLNLMPLSKFVLAP
jgi:hypothetical protein